MSRVESGDWTVCSAGEGGGSSPEMLQTLQSSKKLENDGFSKLWVRVSRAGSARALSFQCFLSPQVHGSFINGTVDLLPCL